jgi:hypothetical protein
MLYFAIKYRKAIEALTLGQKNNLRQFELKEEEWDVAEELMDMLKVHDAIVTTLSDKSYLLYCRPHPSTRLQKILKDATLFFSRGTPNLVTVLLATDHIDSTFTDYTLPACKKHPAVRAALGVAKKTLNKYYSLTNYSELYHIAMGMIFIYFFQSQLHLNMYP